MNIMINAISARLGGGQTYLRQLLARLPERQDLTVYLMAPETLPVPDKANLVKLDTPNQLVTSIWRRSWWERNGLPKLVESKKIDLVFFPGGSINGQMPAGCKTAVTFQNMLPFDGIQVRKYGWSYPGIRNRLLKRQLVSSMKRADLVIFISEYARDFINQTTGNGVSHSVLIPHGVDSAFRPDDSTTEPLPDWLKGEEYILYVSPLDVYKAQLEVIKAYAMLADRIPDAPTLVLVGTPLNASYTDEVHRLIRSKKLTHKFIFKGHVDQGQLPQLYQHAIFNIFASETENCPFILLEALAAGRPVLSSNRPPMPEFAGDAALYFDPSNPHELADKMQEYLESPVLRERMSELSLAKSFQYDWDDSASKTWNALMTLGGSSKP
jgi:glycosyltransferase involved in cell wall biosynthesis